MFSILLFFYCLEKSKSLFSLIFKIDLLHVPIQRIFLWNVDDNAGVRHVNGNQLIHVTVPPLGYSDELLRAVAPPLAGGHLLVVLQDSRHLAAATGASSEKTLTTGC